MNVNPFASSIGELTNIDIGTMAIAFDCTKTMKTFVIFGNQSLHIPEMDTHLIATFQARDNGIIVNDVPLQQLSASERNQYSHSIVFPAHGDVPELIIPLDLNGVMSGALFRVPTWDEVNDTEMLNVYHVHLTSDEPWDPHSKGFHRQEQQLKTELEQGRSLWEPASREISQLQVRGPDKSQDEMEFSLPLADGDEAWLMDRSVHAVDVVVDAASLSRPNPSDSQLRRLNPSRSQLEGTVDDDNRELSAVEMAAKWDAARRMQPRQPSRTIASISQLQDEQFDSYGAPDVDSFAETLLAELGVTENYVQQMAVSLAANTTLKKRKGFVAADKLAKNWGIGKEAAKRTVESTTQMAVRDFKNTAGSRRLKPYAWMLRFPRRSADVFTDTLVGKVKSMRGNRYMQVYATDFHHCKALPMEKKSDTHYTLTEYFKDCGIPASLIPDNAKELREGEFGRVAKRYHCPIRPVESYTPNANTAEDAIRELKRMYAKVMTQTGCPEVYWDYCFEWCANVRSHTALNIPALQGRTPAAKLTGETPDISFLAEFGFYDWVWHISPAPQGTLQRKRLGRYLGPALNHGDAMCGYVMRETGFVVDRSSIIPLSDEENRSEEIKQLKAKFTAKLEETLKDRAKAIESKEDYVVTDSTDDSFCKSISEDIPVHIPHEPWEDLFLQNQLGLSDEDVGANGNDKQPVPDIAEADADGDWDYDRYITAKVKLPHNGHHFAVGKVIARARDENGELVGKANENPLLDTSMYEVQFDDGTVERYHANIIAEHIYNQVDRDGYGMELLDEIIGYKRDKDALTMDKAFITVNGQRRRVQTTKGWWLLARLQDQSTMWYKLKDLKESHPLEVAQYARDNELEDEPAFRWWVPYTLAKRNRILKAMKKRYFRTEQKFGIECPKTVERAYQIDKETGTKFWTEAIKKEMDVVDKAFEVLPEGSGPPPGYKFIKCHMVFDVKAGTLQRKARFVADGSRVEPEVPIYASVVSRESVRIAFLLAALNGQKVMGADCEGAYLNADSREKLYTKLGPEMGLLAGRYAKIVRALYGSRSAAASWRSAISGVIEAMNFQMCRADNDVWMRRSTNGAGVAVWEYVLVYSDDLLVVSGDPLEILTRIDQYYKLKEGSVGPPEKYLGANVGQLNVQGTDCWYMSSQLYTENALVSVAAWLEKRGLCLPKRTANVLPSGWRPETDVTKELNEEDTSYYQQQIGVLRWMVELGRIDICTEVSMLAAHSACPRQGHLAAVFHLYAYLKNNPKSKLVFDPTRMNHGAPIELDQGWRDCYKQTEEVKPPDMPEPLGEPVQTTCFVDSDHAGDMVNRRSRTGVLIFVNRSPIVFYSKKQGSIETSSYGSELSAMKTAIELVEGLRYKLRMMGVPLDGSTHVLADNMSVVHNCSNPASQLKKKSNSIAYHYCRERVAMGVVDIMYVKTTENLADMLTKSQPGIVRKQLADQVLF